MALRHPITRAILLGALLPAGCALRAQVEPGAEPPTISANRPGFTDSPSLVPPDHVQIETGYLFTKRNRSGTETERHAVPEVLARYRLLDRLEAQVMWGGYAFQHTRSGGATAEDDGDTDLGFGARVPLADQQLWMPALSLGGSATVGTGDDPFSTGDHTVPTGKVIWAYSLPHGVGLGGNFVVSYPFDGQDRFDQYAASLYGSHALAERASVFAEYFVVTPYANHTGPAHTVDAGAFFLVRRTVQLDARVGFGLNDEADDFFTGFGFSFLF